MSELKDKTPDKWREWLENYCATNHEELRLLKYAIACTDALEHEREYHVRVFEDFKKQLEAKDAEIERLKLYLSGLSG